MIPKKNNKIKVCYLSDAPFISGSERCLQNIILNLDKNKFEVFLVTSKFSPLNSWAKINKVKVFNAELIYSDKIKMLSTLLESIKLLFFISKNKIDIIHANQIWPLRSLKFWRKLTKAKIVCHFRDPVDRSSRWWLPYKIDSGIAISNFIENQILINIADRMNNILTIIDPVKAQNNNETLSNSNIIKKNSYNYNEFDTVVRLGFIGQISPIKGLFELLKLLNENTKTNWHLFIAGKAQEKNKDYLEKIIAYVNENKLDKKITFLGFIENTSEFYNNIDIVIVPSIEEPLGLIPLEAASFGVPSIVTNVGGLPETIQENITGCFLDLSNPKSLEDAFSFFIKEDCCTLKNNCIQWSEKFSIAIYIEKLSNLYEDVLQFKK